MKSSKKNWGQPRHSEMPCPGGAGIGRVVFGIGKNVALLKAACYAVRFTYFFQLQTAPRIIIVFKQIIIVIAY